MSRSRFAALAAILLLFAYSGWRLARRNAAVSQLETKAPAPSAAAPAPLAPPSASRAHETQPVSGNSQPVSEDHRPLMDIPRRELVRREVEANPHATPASVIAFAKALAPQMSAALDSPVAALEFFSRLENCVQERGTVASIQALCGGNAQRLAQKYPVQLKGRYERLFEQAPREVQSLLRAAEALQQ